MAKKKELPVDVVWFERVIESCKTFDQLENCRNWINEYIFKKYNIKDYIRDRLRTKISWVKFIIHKESLTQELIDGGHDGREV